MARKNNIQKSSPGRLKRNLILVGVLVVVSLLIVFPATVNAGLGWLNSKANIGLPLLPDKGFNLGLDLQGGAHLIYQAKTDSIPDADRTAAVEGVRDVIERRVRGGLGVAEPLVQTTKVGKDYRVIVELPGVTDVNQAIKMIGETPILEFKEENTAPARDLTAQEQKQLDDFNAAANKKANEALAAALKPKADFAALAAKYSEDADSKSKGGDLGLINSDLYPELYKWAATAKDGHVGKSLIASYGGLNIAKRISARPAGATSTPEFDVARIYIKTKSAADFVPPSDQWKSTGLSGKQLQRAEVTQDYRTGQVQVSLKFNDEGSKLFSDITTRNVGKTVAIFLDGTPISIPRVNEPITSGSAVISGSFTLSEAKLLAQRLNAGALPVAVDLISQQKVEATLGAEYLHKSFFAGIIGLALVLLFMIGYYRFPGLLADVSLIVYALLSLAIFKLIGVTLTLSGIAGFVLSVGMAVDANVLVFERMKEELQAGRSLLSAAEESFLRAWPSIRDSNITTLISCAFLTWFGTGFVQGFAVTLAIGTLVSMFTAITVTRINIRFVFRWFSEQGSWMFLGAKKVEAPTQTVNTK